MPELPEVHTVVETLRPAILGRLVQRFDLLRDDFAQPAGHNWVLSTSGRRIAKIERRAKRIIISLDNASAFFAHLGMTGRLTFGPSDRPRAPHTHVVIGFEHGEVHFSDPRRFGGLVWLGGARCDEGLGPEPLSLRARELGRRLAGTKRAIKSALLDQELIAGLGNIYVDEALFRAGIHPMRRADRLDCRSVVQLNLAIKAVLRKAIRHRGSTLRNYVDANGKAGSFRQLHVVYGCEGKPCVNCGRRIRRIVLGGRSTHYCPTCQPRNSRSR